jgi:hypothetical protein
MLAKRAVAANGWSQSRAVLRKFGTQSGLSRHLVANSLFYGRPTDRLAERNSRALLCPRVFDRPTGRVTNKFDSQH